MLSKFQIFKLASMMMWAILLMMIGPTFYIMYMNLTIIIEWNLLTVYSTPVVLPIIIDPVGMCFSCTVMLISASVLQFSTIYMKDDKFINRFTVLVLLFITSMNLLIFLPHLMILLLGWDGLGLVSFILVIYYQNPKSLGAGMITALTNRIGDVMLLLAIAWTLNQGHWSITHMWHTNMYMYQMIAITVAAMTKSAQMPFSSWLPAAMAAPTPVSALVHSSTLVTAGVFLLIRFSSFLSTFKMFSSMMLMVAVLTTTMAGISAMTECDMKKIIALSTLSQLGMMMTAMGLNLVQLAFFHMVTHAMFKALLFICAGTLINSHMHSQDLRWMGNTTFQLPTTSSCFMLANCALCGIPFMSGFYSKDLIIESSAFFQYNFIMVVIIAATVGLTSFYSMRFSLCTTWGPTNGPTMMSMEENNSLTTPMLVLTSMSIISGSAIMWAAPLTIDDPIITTNMKLLPLVMTGMGAFMAYLINAMNYSNKSMVMETPTSHYASCFMWFLVPLSTQLFMKAPMFMAHNLLKNMDQAWFELLGGQGVKLSSTYLSNKSATLFNSGPVNYLILSSFLLIMMLIVM